MLVIKSDKLYTSLEYFKLLGVNIKKEMTLKEFENWQNKVLYKNYGFTFWNFPQDEVNAIEENTPVIKVKFKCNTIRLCEYDI